MSLIVEHVNKNIQEKEDSYKITIKNLKSDYNKEKESKDSYRGRELLELLQNADDELNDSLPKEVKISLKDNNLSIANYGEPFTEEGIDSLMWSNLSAKRKRLKETIGCKGTGFRSILGWSKTISIDSGDLHILFSDEYAQECLKKLYSDKLEEIRNIKAPTLVFPKIVNNYKQSKYTTNITIEIKDEYAKKDIEKQLKNLDAKILLFLNRIEILIIENESRETKYIKTSNSNDVTIKTLINGKEEKSKTWFLKKDNGKINVKNDDGKIEEKNYSISIAYSSEDENESNNVLYSFFPTDVDFPYPVILHATFELNSDRNHLIKSNVNKELLKRSFELLVELALEINTKPNYDALSFVINNREFGAELAVYDCDGLLKEVIVNNKMFPNVNNEMLKFDKDILAFYNNEFPKYLRGEQFNDLLKYAEDKKVFDYINDSFFGGKCSVYDEKSVIEVINEWTKTLKPNDLSMKKLAHTLSCGADNYLCASYTPYKEETIYLNALFDQDRNLVSCKNELFLNQSENSKITSIPSFACIKLLDSKLSQYLDEENKNKNNDLLETLNIHEFNMSNIISSMNKKIEDIYENDISKAKKYAREELLWLWKNRKRIKNDDIGSGVRILNFKNDLVLSNELYYGKEYDNPIINKLVEPKSIVADITKIIDINNADLKDVVVFLELLGVAKYPRKIPMEIHYCSDYYYNRFCYYSDNQYINDSQFIDHFLDELEYSIRIEGAKPYNKKEELYRDTNFICFDDYIIKELDYILENAKTKDILDWILQDNELKERLNLKTTLKNVHVQIGIGSKRNPRLLDGIYKPLSNIYWKFYNKKWIEKGEKRYQLSECFDSKVDLSPYLCNPKGEDYASNKDDIKKYNEIFENLDINEDFSKLSIDLIYKILKALPTIENSKEIAKSFYLNLIKSNLEGFETNEFYKDFINDGEVLSNNGYKKITNVYYAEEITIPKQLNEKYNLICLGFGKNSKKIKNFLGVDKLKFKSQIIGMPELHSLNEYFTKDFEKYKVLAYCYRIGKNKEDSNRLKRLNVFLCSYVRAKFNNDEVVLQDYEYMQSGNKYYVKIPDDFTKDELYRADFSKLISEIMCNCLKLTDDSEIYKSFRELYSKGANNERGTLIHQDIEDKLTISKAMEIMDAQDSIRENFISFLKNISKKDMDAQYSLIDQIDFENFNDESNITIFIDLFKNLGIDIEQYNEKEPDKYIDIINYYHSKIDGIKSKYRDIYKSTLFSSSKKESIDAKSNFLIRLENDYDAYELKVKNSVYFDCEKEFINQFNIKTEVEVIDFNNLKNNNIEQFKNNLENAEHLDDFIGNNNENLSLLYFGEYDVLKERYEHLYCGEKKIDTPIREETYMQITTTISSNDFSTRKPQRTVTQKTSKEGGIGYKKRDAKNQEKIGLEGERLAYESLIKNDDITNVEWVSENAQKAKVNPEGRAGLGYDIEYLDVDGILKYIEVKTTISNQNNEIKFYMSGNEYEFAKENYKNYSIYYVVLKDRDGPKLVILNDVFNENGFNSDRYGINANEYTIMTQIIQEEQND